ncbi:MAG: aminomethyl-transferring glycine dehydrogenase subunit GcvPA [Abditibacteriaceae bacterium]
MAYFSLTENDQQEMLRTIGVDSVDALFADIPENLRQLARQHYADDLGDAQSELAVLRRLSKVAARNVDLSVTPSFLGAGSYDHYIPSVVPAMLSRGEFATAYTPYQAEVSQGTLQVIYEFQTLLCQLTGMELANASLYDGATALAEAVIMACAVTKKNRLLWSRSVSPLYRNVALTYTQGLPIEFEEVPLTDGRTDVKVLSEKLGDDVAAVIIPQTNFFGVVEDYRGMAELAHQHKVLAIGIFQPITLGILEPPGSWGADIAVGEGQPLGINQQFGGPGVGLFCCKQEFARHSPGRLAGLTQDTEGRRGFTLTLQTREQHIRREKATSNICTNQALCALAASVYLSAVGPSGLREAAHQSYQKAHYASAEIAKLDGFENLFASPFFMEWAVKLPRSAAEINAHLEKHGIISGYDLSKKYPELGNALLFCCTEKRTREDIDALVDALREVQA